MKIKPIHCLICSFCLFISCGNNSRNAAAEDIQATSVPEVMQSIIRALPGAYFIQEGYYSELPVAGQPLTIDDSLASREDKLLFPAVDVGKLTGYVPPEENNYAMRSGNDLLLITTDSLGSGYIVLFSVTDALAIRDKIDLYRNEVEWGNTVTTSSLINNDTIMREKRLDNKHLIERLFYKKNSHYIFEEIRDGKTPAITYMTPDGRMFRVETFTWDLNQRGGLIRKDEQGLNYEFIDGRFVNTEDLASGAQQ